MNESAQIILGIDPGLASTGYGVISKEGDKLTMIDYGLIATPAGEPFELRLKSIYDQLSKLLVQYKPSLLAIEELFFAKNAKTALLVGQARGVVITCCVLNNLKVCEFTPLQVKQAVTGFGRAEKKQMQQMVKILLNLEELPWPDDAADALAVAMCGAVSQKPLAVASKK